MEALGFANWQQWVSGSTVEVDRRAEEMIAVSNEQGFPLWAGWGMVHRGWSLTALGRAEEGCNSSGMDFQHSELLDNSSVCHQSRFVAEAHAKLGRLAEGQKCLAEAAQLIEASEERQDEAEFHGLRGDLSIASGDQAAAEANYRRALALARQQSAKTFELRAATSLARMLRDQGNRNEARDVLAPVYNWFTEGLDMPVLQDAKKLLDQLSAA